MPLSSRNKHKIHLKRSFSVSVNREEGQLSDPQLTVECFHHVSIVLLCEVFIISDRSSLDNTGFLTVIMVTHEPDIAAYTKRTIVMRDGRVVSDLPVTRRLIADEELAKLESVPLTGEARAIA